MLEANELAKIVDENLSVSMHAITDDQLILVLHDTDDWLRNNAKTFPKDALWGGMVQKKFVIYRELNRRFEYAR